MSVQSTPETYTCSYCSQAYTPIEKVEGSYCSKLCYYRKQGQDALRQIESDHTWCATCFRQIKTIQRPQKKLVIQPAAYEHDVQPKDVLVGYQYPTEHMVWAIDDDERDYRYAPRGTWACTCGNIDLSNRDPTLIETDITGTITRLYECLQAFHEKGALQTPPDRDAYFQALRDQWRDWPYAVGRALHTPR